MLNNEDTGPPVNDRLTAIQSAASEKFASDISILCLQGLTSITDYFFICTAESTVQAKAIADAISERMEESGARLLHEEGRDSASWVLLDYGTIIVHIFLKEIREFYSLELLWADAPALKQA